MQKVMKNSMGIVLILCLSLVVLIALPAVAGDRLVSPEEELTAKYDAYLAEQERADALSQLEAATTVAERQAILNEFSEPLFGTQTTSELVLYPLSPCRIVDTRYATRWGSPGPISAGETISIWTYGVRSDQGGEEVSSCGVVSNAAAVVINVTVVPVAGNGYLKVYPSNSTPPNASLVNYEQGGQHIANAVVQSQCYGCGNELDIYSYATSHVIIDVIGYFARPTATPLDNVVVTNVTTVPINGFANVLSPICPAGYRLTGGGCNFQFGDIETQWSSRPASTGVNVNQWLCQGYNSAPGATGVTSYAVCSRIPGQ